MEFEMTEHRNGVARKVIIVTGAGGGIGRPEAVLADSLAENYRTAFSFLCDSQMI
jgi:hypothetical protein